MTRPDVTVLGAGIFGLSVAWACARRGARVQLIDPAGPGAGCSGGLVGALAPHVPEAWNELKAFQFDSLLMAGGFWAEVAQVSGISPGYARLGRLQPIADADALALARARAESARGLWRGEARWEVVETPRQGWAPVSPSGWLIRDTLSARLNPRRACASLAAALETRGARLLRAGTPQGLVVHATGVAGLQELSRALGRMVGGPVKGQAALLHLAAPDRPQIHADGILIVPHADGTVAVGSTSEREFDDPARTDARLDEVITRATRLLPVLHGARVVERWAGLRPRARSRAPMLGEHPLRPGEFIANGGFKTGFGMAPKVGEAMADLLLEGRDTIPARLRPEASL
ncbi:MAG: FAD-dependent oxidoreductase [Roseovarius sp.]